MANPPVRKIDIKKLQALIELVSSGVLKLADQARLLDVGPDTIRSWKIKSNRGDPQTEGMFFGVVQQFGAAYLIAERLAMLELKATAMQFSIHGRKRRTLNQGQFVVALNPAAIPLDREMRVMLGYHPDALMLNEHGEATFVEEHVDPPTGLLDRFLSTFPELQTTTNQNINVKGGLQVGVGIVPKVDYTKEPPPLPPMPVVPLLEILDAEPDDADLALAALLGEELDVEPDVVVEPEPEPMSAIAVSADVATVDPNPPSAPVAFDATPARPAASALERDLYQKLREARERAAAVKEKTNVR